MYEPNPPAPSGTPRSVFLPDPEIVEPGLLIARTQASPEKSTCPVVMNALKPLSTFRFTPFT